MDLNRFFDTLWHAYISKTPQAEKIYQLIQAHNGQVVNDHVAFRTFNRAPINIESIEPCFLAMGYRVFDEYDFPRKKLCAKAFINEDESQPKLFLSELVLEACSNTLQTIVDDMLANADLPATVDETLFFQGTPWPTVSWHQYQTLLEESEYAAWLSVMGFCANHFTIFVNRLAKNDSLDEVIELVQSLGLTMNEAGGLIKGNAMVGLQQASTMADDMDYCFAEGDVHRIKTCYYEFALRYPDELGQLYQGFVADSADKIFESTHHKLASM